MVLREAFQRQGAWGCLTAGRGGSGGRNLLLGVMVVVVRVGVEVLVLILCPVLLLLCSVVLLA